MKEKIKKLLAKKSAKPIFMSVMVLLFALAMWGVFTFILPEEEEIPMAYTASDAETVYIIKRNYLNVNRIEISCEGNEDKLVVQKMELPSGVYWDISPQKMDFLYNQGLIRGLIKSACSAAAVRIVSNPAALSVYGLDDPQCTVFTTYEDGKTVTMYIGDATPSADGYFVKLDTSDTVYVYNEENTETLMRNESSYRDMNFVTYYEDAAVGNFTYIKVERPDGTGLTVEKMTQAEIENEYSSYKITAPLTLTCDDEMVDVYLLKPANAITFSHVVEDNPTDLKKYGLDNPTKVTFTTIDNETVTYLIGNKDEDEYYRYIMNTEYNTVLASLCTYWESYDTVEYVDVMVEVLWMPEIEEVTKIEFYNNGKEHTLDISIDSGIVDFKLDGQKISEENGRRLYVRVLSIFAVNSAEGKEYGEMEYKYTMYMKSGETHVMELFPINIRQYAVKVDGVLTFYASINAVDRITNAIQTVLNGGTLSSTF